MPLTSAQKTTLTDDAQALVSAIAALNVDPDGNPLQAQIDAANAQLAQLAADKAKLQADLDDMGKARDELAAKITNARQALA